MHHDSRGPHGGHGASLCSSWASSSRSASGGSSFAKQIVVKVVETFRLSPLFWSENECFGIMKKKPRNMAYGDFAQVAHYLAMFQKVVRLMEMETVSV